MSLSPRKDDGWFFYRGRPAETFKSAKLLGKRLLDTIAFAIIYHSLLVSMGAVPFESLEEEATVVILAIGKQMIANHPWSAFLANLAAKKGQPIPDKLKRILNVESINFLLGVTLQLSFILDLLGYQGPATVLYGSILSSGLISWIWQSQPISKIKSFSSRVAGAFNKALSQISCGWTDVLTSYR